MPASDAEAPTRDKRRRINARPRKDAVADYLGVLVAALVLPGDAMACDAGGVAASTSDERGMQAAAPMAKGGAGLVAGMEEDDTAPVQDTDAAPCLPQLPHAPDG